MIEEIKNFVLTYWKWILLVIFILIIILITKKRKYFWKDKQGNKIGFKEFMKRWKDGLSGVSPLQQSKMQVLGTWITLAGILAGIVINILVRMENQWPWILTVLVGSLIITGISQVGALQKYWILKRVAEEMKKLESPFKELNPIITLAVENGTL